MSTQEGFFQKFTSTDRGRGFFLACFCVIGVVGAFLWLREPPTKSAKRIAVNLPLSGPVAVFFDPFPRALRLGIEDELKRQKLPPETVKIDVQDNAFKSDQAKTILLSQKTSKMDAYISGSSDISVALFPDLDASGVPHFLVAFDAYMVDRGKNRLRLLPHYKIEGPLWVTYAKSKHAKRILALTLNNAAIEEEFTSLVEPGLKEANIDLQRERFGFEGADFRSLIAKGQAYNPDLIFVSGYSFHLEPALNAIRASALKAKPVMTAMDLVDLVTQRSPLSLIQGVAFVAPEFEIADKTGVKGTEQKRAFNRRYADATGKVPNYIAAYGYDTGTLLARVLGEQRDKDQLATRADFLRQTPIDGVSGRVTLDANGDLASTLRLVTVGSDYQLTAVGTEAKK